MTPAERAVLDAARALVPEIECAAETTGYEPSAKAGALITAVRALPRPLSEQLAELRPGAVVEHSCGGPELPVLANIPSHGVLICDYEGGISVVEYRYVTRIISNPEADRG